MFWTNLKSVASPDPKIIPPIRVLGGSNLEEEEAVASRRWYRSKEHWSVPIGPP